SSGSATLAGGNLFIFDPRGDNTSGNQLISAGVDGELSCSSPLISRAGLSGGGLTVVYNSSFPQLKMEGGNGLTNVYRYSRPQGAQTGTITLVSHAPGAPSQDGDASSGLLADDTPALAASPDGRFIAFVSQATDLTTNQG